ncbi:MAG: hypothetical protein ACI9CO_000104 [Candidatus Azotimanducaceae bacterium]
MSKYIKYFPKPFLDDLVVGRCVPFVGAGFSKNARFPPSKNMPLWDDLGKELASAIPDYEYTGAIDAISAYEHEYSRPKLIEQLQRSLLVDCAQPGPAHKSFCELPFDLAVTSNFEFLLERGYDSISRYCRPIIDEDQLSVDFPGPEIKLLKIHGDLHHPNRMIATENDYDTFLDRYPLLSTYLANLLIVKTAFFVGYSLDDPDFRQIWQVIGDRLGKLRRLAYTISVSAPAHAIARFERRGVKVINLPGKPQDYPNIMEDAFNELREYWADKILEGSTSTDDESLAELSLPKSEASRLCFFSVPSRLSAYYKAELFPIAERNGLVPLIATDVISAGESITAKVSALLDRAEAVVIDTSSPTTQLELKMALNKKNLEGRVFLIVEEGSRTPTNISESLHIVRPTGSESEKENFINTLDLFFEKIAKTIRSSITSEPDRLYKKREYRASVISAIAWFEIELRERLGKNDKDKNYGSVHQILKRAIDMQVIDQRYYRQVREWMHIRNEAVHQAKDISARDAKMIVSGVTELLNELKQE